MITCVAVVSVSFKPSGASAPGHWAKGAKKVGAGGRGGEGKETPAAEPRHFTERPQMASLPWGLHCHVKCHMRTNHVNLSENRIAGGNLFTSSCSISRTLRRSNRAKIKLPKTNFTHVLEYQLICLQLELQTE